MPAPLSASVHDKPLAKAQDDIKAALAKQKQLSKKNTATDLIGALVRSLRELFAEPRISGRALRCPRLVTAMWPAAECRSAARSLGTSARGQNQALTNSSVTLKAPRLPHHEGMWVSQIGPHLG
jgi:hypothetical protein